MTGLLGQAAAAQTTSSPQATQPPPAVIALSPPPSPAPSPSAAAPSSAPPSTSAPSKVAPQRTEKAIIHKRKTRTGPAGSLLFTGTDGVALTFDDGPDPDYTPVLLRMLAREKIKATFCVVGTQAKRHPELVRAIAKAGHTLCNHTWNHDLKLGKKPVAKIKADMERTNAAIRAAVPNAQIRFFRAPGGHFNGPVVATAKKLGMTSIYWKVDPRDWEHPAGESHPEHRKKIIRIVQKHTRPGAIVLSHDYAQPDTIAAYRTLLPWLRQRFKLVAL
ncbi:polysaccharide deacetylase family protein [Actinoplanes sp. NPDC024001]|uniref:polysaccharide deacetylase family protein n=1 Tax=Actinoplanes sp. NPDC024001 TaxID=3154598 RepID=UPI0033EC7FC6